MPDSKRIEQLMKYGFTQTESQVYLELLKKSPQTGYSIAKSINKTRSSTYLVLGNLEAKGAVTKLMGTEHQEYIPTGIKEFLDNRELAFQQLKDNTLDMFQNLEAPDREDQIYYLKSKEELKSLAIEMIACAKEIVLVDSEAMPIFIIKEALVEAAERGVKVVVECMGEEIIPGAENIKSVSITEKEDWDFDWLILSADSEKTLIAYMNKSGEFLSGIWNSNVYLSDWFSNGMFYEIMVRYIIGLFKTDLKKDNIIHKIEHFHQNNRIRTAGFNTVQETLKSLQRIHTQSSK